MWERRTKRNEEKRRKGGGVAGTKTNMPESQTARQRSQEEKGGKRVRDMEGVRGEGRRRWGRLISLALFFSK